MLCLFLAVLLSAAASAQQAARVNGRVLAQNGDPIRRANVNLLGPNSYQGLTDNNGTFTIDGVAPGRYSLTAEAPGYAAQKYGAQNPLLQDCTRLDSYPPGLQRCTARVPGTTLSITAGQELKDILIPLTKFGTISGRLTDQDGDPVPRYVVQAMQMNYQGGTRQVRPARGEGRPDANGNFTIRDLLPGRYYLYALDFAVVSFPGRPERQGKASLETDLPTYFPSEGNPSRAVPVDVAPGSELHGMDIRLRRSRVYSIRGSVTAPADSGPIESQILLLRLKGVPSVDFNLANPRQEIVRANGAFEFRNLEPGTYVLSGGQALGNPPAPPPLFARQEVTISSTDAEGVKLVLSRGIDLAGTFRLEGEGAPEWPVAFLQNMDGLANTSSTPPERGGAFSIAKGIAPSPYLIYFSHLPPGTYLKSISYGGRDAIHSLLDLTGGGDGSLEIVLSSKVATIFGEVKKPGVVVSAWPRVPEVAGGIKSVSSDQDGHFEISDLGPGDYFLAAWENIDRDLLQAVSFLTRFQGEVSTVTLDEGARVSADAKVITAERVTAELAKLP